MKDQVSMIPASGNEADEIQLHKNLMAFVGGMVSGGMIDADDLLED